MERDNFDPNQDENRGANLNKDNNSEDLDRNSRQDNRTRENGTQDNYRNSNDRNYYNQRNSDKEVAPVMSILDWVKTEIIRYIPFVGFILLIIWAVSSNPEDNPNRRNWARANLIVSAIVILVTFILMIIFGAIIAATVGEYYNSYGY